MPLLKDRILRKNAIVYISPYPFTKKDKSVNLSKYISRWRSSSLSVEQIQKQNPHQKYIFLDVLDLRQKEVICWTSLTDVLVSKHLDTWNHPLVIICRCSFYETSGTHSLDITDRGSSLETLKHVGYTPFHHGWHLQKQITVSVVV